MEPIGMETKRLGNTKAKRFLITLNDVGRYEEMVKYILGIKALKYYVAAREKAPTTGHEHIHAYVSFDNARNLSLNKMCGAHIDKCRGSHKQNIDYVKKDGDIIEEHGEIPRERGGSHTVKELKEIKTPDELDYKEYNTWTKIHQKENANIDIENLKKDVKVYYIQGDPGVGKTEKMKAIVRKNKEKYGTKINMLKYENNFWIGLGSARIAVYDDFRDSHMKASEFINFIDYNKHYMNVKGGSELNEYELIIITSVLGIDEIYKKFPEEGKNQWMRRVEVIDMFKKKEEKKTEYEKIECDIDIDEL